MEEQTQQETQETQETQEPQVNKYTQPEQPIQSTNVTDKLKEKYEFELMSGAYKTNHILHVIVSVITFGWWLFGWGIVAWYNDVNRVKAEKIVYGMSEPSIPTRIFGILATIFLVLTILGFIVSGGAIVEQYQNEVLHTNASSVTSTQ